MVTFFFICLFLFSCFLLSVVSFFIRIDSKDQMFMIETEQVTEMKENYAITPYVFVKVNKFYIIV